MKKNNWIIPIFIFILSVTIGYLTGVSGYIINYNIKTNKLLSEDYINDMFYNLHPTVNNVQSEFDFSIYDDQLNYGFSEEFNNEIKKIEGIQNIYPYIALPFLNYYDSVGQVNETTIKIDGKEIVLNSNLTTNQIIIVPYYPEDNYDQDMEQIFISKDLNDLLKHNNVMLGNNLTITNVRFPISQRTEAVTYTDENDEAHYYNTNQVNFERSDITFNNITSLNKKYYSSLYKTPYAILMPYTQLYQLIEQHKSNSEDNFTIPTQKIYYTSPNHQELLNKINGVNNEIVTNLLAVDIESNLIEFNTTFKNNFLLSIALLISVFILNTLFYLKIKYLKKSEYFIIPFILFICTSITNYIIFSKLNLFYEFLIIVIILLLFLEALFIRHVKLKSTYY